MSKSQLFFGRKTYKSFSVFSSASSFCYVVEEDEVTFYLYTRNSGETQITANNFDAIDPSKTFHFIIHGWVANHELQWIQSMTDAYLEQNDCNVIQVDWRKPAAQLVYVSARNTKDVGWFIDLILSPIE